ncbi:hypothetical protein C8R43DRAFT_582603 [Mycena crocata]|nr:hypothetical protein C8R43DRAFT_582603 [Mycena crocata]
MRLVLTTGSPANAIYTDATGAPRYKVNTPFKLSHRTTAISRAIEGEIPRRNSWSDNVDEEQRFASLAHINWRVFESSVIRFRGSELATRDLFRKDGWGCYGRHRIFTALDGREYKWILGAYTSQLKVNDDTETVVARYRPKKLGLFSKPRKASLEILPPFEHLMDEILVTFVYIERVRKQKERAARSPTLLNK